MAAIVNSIIAGSTISLFINTILSLSTIWAIGAGIVVFLVTFVAHKIYQWSHLKAMEKTTQVEFPSQAKNKPHDKKKKKV
jgi:uncharacterized membrane protein (DUF485 family)